MSKIDIYVTVILNVATDIYLMTIPAPVRQIPAAKYCPVAAPRTNSAIQMLLQARLRWREKLELAILFSGGLFVMMAGILRCVLILTVSL